MKNILSYKLGTVFNGEEILNWLNYQIKYHTSHEKEAIRLHHRYGITLKANHNYIFYRGQERINGPDVLMISRKR